MTSLGPRAPALPVYEIIQITSDGAVVASTALAASMLSRTARRMTSTSQPPDIAPPGLSEALRAHVTFCNQKVTVRSGAVLPWVTLRYYKVT